MGLEIKKLDCVLTCDICKAKIPIEQESKKVDMVKDEVHTSIADVTIRISPVYQDDANCEVVQINCNERQILCHRCGTIYRNHKEALWANYNVRNQPESLLSAVKDQI